MATTPVTLGGVTYYVPQPGEAGPTYDQNLTNYLIALATAFPQVGGQVGFSVLGSSSANPATAGNIRLAHTDTIDWRNNANTANLTLGVGVSGAGGVDDLSWNGIELTGQCCAIYQASSTTALANSTQTVVNYNVSVLDTDSAVTTGSAWIFTVPANKGGRYLVSSHVALATIQTGTTPWLFNLVLFKTGVPYDNLAEYQSVSTAAQASATIDGTVIVSCVAGDTLQIKATQTSTGGGSVNTNTNQCTISIQRMV
jgi:hypothetical protein